MITRLAQRLPAQTIYYFLIVLFSSFLTYFYNYSYPSNVFWDEPYHIASAQKYLNHVYFMEPHPPLGKLLIALGEKVTHSNARNDQFVSTDYAQNFPDKFSFTGYRLFPALLGWLTAPLFFLILLLLTRSSTASALLSFLYVFDNALIVHSRGAMLDTTILFLMATMILLMLLMRDWRERTKHIWWLSTLFGVSFGLLMTTKLNGLIMVLLFPAVVYFLYPRWKSIAQFIALSSIGFIVAFCAIWSIHFRLGTTINTKLPDNGYYQASAQYKSILTKHLTSQISSFPVMLRDSFHFVSHYNQGVPRIDLCKADENGSPFFFWPLGARSINYRWTQVNNTTYRYLYLQVNPVVWLCGLLGVLLSFALLFGRIFVSPAQKLREPELLVLFSVLYVGYMIAISGLNRVMYLYHYFPPLFFSFILFTLVLLNVQHFGKRVVTDQQKVGFLLIVASLIFGGFQIYRPFTYYQPITNQQVERRAIFPLWELTCVGCQKKSLLVVPSK